ncbi:MAG: GtrA family protein [Fibrobacter sp.]|jgi:putative flippase GtrA|nr:GtrA family protein [Fibrobacter sp.]
MFVKSAFVYGLLVSVPATIADWGSFALGVDVLRLHYVFSSLLAAFCGATVNAILSRKIAFTSKGRTKKQEMTLLYMTAVVSYFITLGFLAFFIEIVGIEAKLAKVITTFIVFFINYGVRQFFIFDSKPRW